MITLRFNGQKITLESPLNLSEFLRVNNIESQHIAIAINRTFLPRSEYASYRIKANDSIECVTPMQGG